MNKAIGTIMFWLFMLFVAVVLWQIAARSGNQGPREELTYSQFMELAARGEFRAVTIHVRSSSARLDVESKEHSEYSLVIARETIPEVTRVLSEQKVIVQFREVSETDPLSILINLTPILLFVGLWIYMIRAMRQKRQGPPGSGGLYS